MKKLYPLLLVVLIAVAIFSIACVSVAAGDSDVYASMNEACNLKVKVDEDNYIPTFNAEKNLIVGVKLGSTINDNLFIPTTDGYTVAYTNTRGEYIGTGTTVSILNANNEVVNSYDIVAYGDINGDAVIDVIDISLCERFATGNFDDNYPEAAMEAALLLNESLVDVYDYSTLVNIALADKSSDKGRKIPLEICNISNPADVTYSGSAFTPAVNVTNDGAAVSSDNYSVSYTNNINAGTATVKITGTNDYVGTVTKTFTINKASLDTKINFESIIYANTGKAVSPKITMAEKFKPFVKIKYNDLETVPSATGIYSLTAEITANSNYTFESETRELGFIVVAPAASASNYAIAVDNSAKTITVTIKSAYASNSTIATDFEKWINGAYSLTVGSTNNPATVASALPNRSFDVYSGQSTSLVKTAKTAVLGCYLPEDSVLWSNSAATNTSTISVADGNKSFSFDVIFQQDASLIKAAKIAMFKQQANQGRGQRTDETRKVANFAKMINDYTAVRVAVKDTSAKCYDALLSTGLKGMLVGYVDAISIQASNTLDFTGQEIHSLFESSGKRYSSYSGIQVANCIPIVKTVLIDLGIPNVPSSTLSFARYAMSNCMDRTGYCNYICAGEKNGLRYNHVIFIEFRNYDSTYEDAKRTLTIGENVTTTCPEADENTYMAGNEPVFATAPSGYTLKLTTSSGKDIPMEDDGYFLMPYEDATITAVPVS